MGESDCPWWGSQVGGAGTLDQAGMRVVGRCGSDSDSWRAYDSVEPVVQPAGCAVLTRALPSADTGRTECFTASMSSN